MNTLAELLPPAGTKATAILAAAGMVRTVLTATLLAIPLGHHRPPY